MLLSHLPNSIKCVCLFYIRVYILRQWPKFVIQGGCFPDFKLTYSKYPTTPVSRRDLWRQFSYQEYIYSIIINIIGLEKTIKRKFRIKIGVLFCFLHFHRIKQNRVTLIPRMRTFCSYHPISSSSIAYLTRVANNNNKWLESWWLLN